MRWAFREPEEPPAPAPAPADANFLALGEYLRAVFDRVDEDGTGMIKASELADILKKKQLNMSTKEIQEMISEVDYHGNGKINYSEFLSATINVRTFMTE